MRPLPTAAFAATLLVISGCTLRDVPGAGVPDPDYPPAPRSEQVDRYFGVEVADPYRWMEDLGAPEVTAWVDAQNAVSVPWLHGLPGYGRFHRRITALWDYERYTPPRVHGGRYFFEYNDGRSDLSTLMVQQGWEGDRRVLIDPATLSEDRTVLLARWNASPDGKFVAWAASDGGTDWTQWRIRSVDTGQDLPEVLRGTKFTEARWLPDSSGFFYSRYPRSGGSWDDQQPVGIWFHAKGTPQSEDRKVFAVTDHPTRNPYGRVSSDGQHLVIEVHQDSRTSGLFYLPMNAPQADAVRLVDSWNGTVSYLGSIDGRFVLKTDICAPLGRIVAVDPDRPGEGGWVDLVAEARFAIEDAVIAGDQLIVHYLQDAHSRIDVFALDGSAAGGIALPGIGKVAALSGTPGDPEIFVRYESFTNPGAILRYRPADGETDLFHQARTTLDAGSLVTEQVFYESADGTRVPMFLVHRAGLVRDATQPTLLYGYGGFNLPQLPSFDIRWAAWLDAGGVLALANIRGGGEYGAAWHAAGTRERKQNVFDDFIAAAVWLIESGVTSAPKLAINGRSNGGLLVGAVQLQRPELFGAATPIVGVLDMLRYHTTSANARAWSGDFGLSEIESDFRAQYAYSPVHNLVPGTCYPPTLIQTAAGDDRVLPWHSYKFAAALQHAQGCEAPVLLRVETRAGHGSSDGKPRWMRIEELAERYAFIAWALGAELPAAD
jgi:prolyl oligopeptidase